MQRESTILFLTYQMEAMEEATKDISRKEICTSLVYIFSKILQKEKSIEEKEGKNVTEENNSNSPSSSLNNVLKDWENFCKSTYASKFWILIDDLYRNLSKWSKAQKGKIQSKFSIFRLMAILVGISQNSTRDSFIDPLIRSVVSQFKGVELCIIFNDFLSNLPFSQINSTSSPNKLSESFSIPLEIIMDTLIQINESTSEEMTNHLIEIGIELGKINLHHAIKLIQSYLLKEDLTMKFVGVSVLRIISQLFIEQFGEIDCTLLFSNLLKSISPSEKIVMQRDHDLIELETQKQKKGQNKQHAMIMAISEEEKPPSDLHEILLTAALGCFPFIDSKPSKHLSLLEKISDFTVSPVFSIAESALFTFRDYILINPGSHFIYGLSLLLKQTIDYLQWNENLLRRIFYNTSTLLYYFNQAIENDFGVDGLNYDKLVLIRNQWEGNLLVWLCHPKDWIHTIAWRILEQLSSPQIRQLELHSTNKQIPHLIDNLPKGSSLSRNLSTAPSFVTLLGDFFDKQYDTFYLAINWAWSNLYHVISPIFLTCKPNSKSNIGEKEFYFHFLSSAPQCAPNHCSFERKHRYLTQSAITRWFTSISVSIKEHYFHRNPLLNTLKRIHPSCLQIILSCLFSSITIHPDSSTTDENLDQNEIQREEDLQFQEPTITDPYVLSFLYQLLLHINDSIFNTESYNIPFYYKKLFHHWFSLRSNSLNKLSLGSKRDFLGILYHCIRYSKNFQSWLPDAICQDSYLNQVLFIIKIIKKILPPILLSSDSSSSSSSAAAALDSQNQSQLQIAVDCTAIQVLISICEQQPFTSHWEKWEDICLSFCSRGIYLQELTKQLFSCYLKQNPSRFQEIIHYCVSSSPSISQTPASTSEYVLSLPLLQSIIISLRNQYESFGPSHLLSLFFCSCFFQCSFDIQMRNLAIELASLLSGHEFKLNEQTFKKLKLKLLSKSNETLGDPGKSSSLNTDSSSPTSHFPSLAKVSQSFKDSFDTVIVSFPQFLYSKEFELSATHYDREVYLVLAHRYCESMAKNYPLLSRDVLRNIIEFTNSISISTDIEMMLSFMNPWISNFNSSTADIQTSRWIIRALFELSYIYLHDESLTLCIRSLWKNLSQGREEELRMALDWIIGFCAREIQNHSHSMDHDRIHICSIAVFNLIHYGSNTMSQFAISFLFDHLRDFSTSQFYNDFYDLLFSPSFLSSSSNSSKKNSKTSFDEYRERAVLILLVSLVIGEKKIDYSRYLPLLLHHCFVVDQFPSDLTSLHAGEDLIANLLLGMEMRPSLIPKHSKLSVSSSSSSLSSPSSPLSSPSSPSTSNQVYRLRTIRNNYFPDTAIRVLSQSELNPFRNLNQTPDSQRSSMSPSPSSSSSSEGKGKRKKTKIRSTDSFPLFVSLTNISRFIDFYESVQYVKFSFLLFLFFNSFFRPTIRSEWANLAFQWAMSAPSIPLAVNSFAVYATITDSISFENVIGFCMKILQHQNFVSFEQLAVHFLNIIKTHWYLLQFKCYIGLTILALTFIQHDSFKLYQFGLEILVCLFQAEECSKHFHEAFSKCKFVWKESKISLPLSADYDATGTNQPATFSLDKIISSYLIRGLSYQETFSNTLWFMEMIYFHFSQDSLFASSSNNYLLILILLSFHVLALSDRSSALDSYRTLKRIDQNSEIPTISGTFKKYYKDRLTDEYLELFYCEFASVYPDEEIFFFSLHVLEDFTLVENNIPFKLASIRALGNFLQYVLWFFYYFSSSYS